MKFLFSFPLLCGIRSFQGWEKIQRTKPQKIRTTGMRWTAFCPVDDLPWKEISFLELEPSEIERSIGNIPLEVAIWREEEAAKSVDEMSTENSSDALTIVDE